MLQMFVGEGRNTFAYGHLRTPKGGIGMQTSLINLTGNVLVPGYQAGGQVTKVTTDPAETKSTEVPATESADELVRLKANLAEHNISLKFSQDETTKSVVVEMIDDKTGEEVNQFPSEVSLKLAANFIRLQGQFINRTR